MTTLPARSFVVLRAKRDTLLLTVIAVAMTFALAHAVRNRGPEPQASVDGASDQKVWAGDLAVAADEKAPPVEKLTSSSLVIHKSAMPKASAGQVVVASLSRRDCDDPTCGRAASSAKAPAAPIRPGRKAESRNSSIMSQINPINYLPNAMRRSLDEAGNSISGWFKRL